MIKVLLKLSWFDQGEAVEGLPYVKGLSEQLRRCLQQQGVRAVFIVLYKITHDQSASLPEED